MSETLHPLEFTEQGEEGSAEYKLEVLREADACTNPGEIGALPGGCRWKNGG